MDAHVGVVHEYRLADAERLYRKAVSVAWDYRAWAGLLALYARGGYTREGMIAAGEICKWWDAQVNPPGTTTPVAITAPMIVANSVYHLIAIHGLQAVRDAQAAIGPAHPAVNELFHDAVRWHVHGFDL